MRILKNLSFSRLLISRSANEDVARREFILNVLLVGIIIVFGIAVTHNALEQLVGRSNSISLWALLVMLVFFILLYVASRLHKAKLSAAFLIALVAFFAACLGYKWGIDLPAGILLYVLAITMAGVLIGTRAAFAATLLIILYISLVGGMQVSGVVVADRSWASIGWHVAEITVAAVILLVIAVVAWLGNREIEKSLMRARRSEHELKMERDQLEVRVAERTEELRKAELDRMNQAYRFVEFGRLAGSIFHDLSNPLTALSLNIDSIAKGANNPERVTTFADDIARAQKAATHMQKLMMSMRRHLASERGEEVFNVHDVLSEVIHILTPYARSKSVSLVYKSPDLLELRGDAVAFQQAVTNIISNAIESFPLGVTTSLAEKSEVSIEAVKDAYVTVLTISDNGSGIGEETLQRIFEPFFSTKHDSGGIGIGLSLAKRVVEKCYGGTIEVRTSIGKGTSFVLSFPNQTTTRL